MNRLESEVIRDLHKEEEMACSTPYDVEYFCKTECKDCPSFIKNRKKA